MRYVCLTCDYDGTIARNGRVSSSTLQALEKVRASGRKLILATGRELPDLLAVVPEASLFDRIVVENGGVLYRPSSKEQVVLADPPPALYCAGVAACRSNTQQGDICTWEISGGRSSKMPGVPHTAGCDWEFGHTGVVTGSSAAAGEYHNQEKIIFFVK
jgi:haloacid dehalogenase-like hydrolase